MEQDMYQRDNTDEIDLMDYVKVILKRKGMIFGIFFIAVLSAAAFSFYMPKVYKIDTGLEIGVIEIKEKGVELVEAPTQVVGKIDGDVYGISVREKLEISETQYPKIKTENPKDTNLVNIEIESSEPEKAKQILQEINQLILTEHQEKVKIKKELLEKNIELLKKDIEVVQRNIERIRIKIGSLQKERVVLENKVVALQKILVYQQTPGTQFALFDTQEKLQQKIQEIEDRYLEINSLETKINSLQNQINSLQNTIETIQATKIVKSPAVSENPVKPRPLLNIVIACVLGLFIGTFLAFFKEWWERANVKT